jgi:hypothetical protein
MLVEKAFEGFELFGFGCNSKFHLDWFLMVYDQFTCELSHKAIKSQV